MNTDTLALRLFGQTAEQAKARGECIRCRLPIVRAALSAADWREYQITAICPVCWVALFPEDDPNVEMVQ